MSETERSIVPAQLARATLLTLLHAPIFAVAGLVLDPSDPATALIFATLGVLVGIVGFGCGLADEWLARFVTTRARVLVGVAVTLVVATIGWALVWLQAAYVVGVLRDRSIAGGLKFVRVVLQHTEVYHAVIACTPFAVPFAIHFGLRRTWLSLGSRSVLGAAFAVTAAILLTLTLPRWNERWLIYALYAGSGLMGVAVPVATVLADRLLAWHEQRRV